MAEEKEVKLVSRISWIVFVGYIVFSFVTFLTIYFFEWVRKLFELTEGIVVVNAVWFSASIAIYGIIAMRKNVRRAKLSNLPIKLDSQFLLVVCFILFTLKEIVKAALFIFVNDAILAIAMKNSVVVLNFGGYVSLLGSIYFGRKKRV